MSDPGHSQGPKVSYREVEDDYFQKRQLKRFAGVFHLWALGVGAVISGDFFWLELWPDCGWLWRVAGSNPVHHVDVCRIVFQYC